VTSDPAGINCGSTCEATFTGGTSVTLTAASGTGATFTGWSGGGCSGTGPAPSPWMRQECGGHLHPEQLPPLGRQGRLADGTVSSSPGGISCGGDCSESYAHGTAVTLTATPAAGATFKEWRGACTGATCSLTVTGATTVTAVFSKVFTDATLTLARPWSRRSCERAARGGEFAAQPRRPRCFHLDRPDADRAQ